MTLSIPTPSKPLAICERVSRLGSFGAGIFAVLICGVYPILSTTYRPGYRPGIFRMVKYWL